MHIAHAPTAKFVQQECKLQISNKTETPKERLKRLMAAQINKQVAKDSVKSAQKIAHEEKERKARIQIERMHYDAGRRSASPDMYRSVLSFLRGLELDTSCGAMAPPSSQSRAGTSLHQQHPIYIAQLTHCVLM